MTYVENVARDIARVMDSYKLIVEKSTVPADTGQRIKRTIAMNLSRKFRKGNEVTLDFDVASIRNFCARVPRSMIL